MSLPRELLDELLSRYMDGELSADELARVEQMLATDAKVRESLNLLKERSSLVKRAVHGGGKLGADFSSRVFAAAIAEAEAANLTASHPLRLAARGKSSFSGHRRAVLAGIFALAASLMLAVFFATRDFGPGELAENGLQEGAATATPEDPQAPEKPAVSEESADPGSADLPDADRTGLAERAGNDSDERIVAADEPARDSLEDSDEADAVPDNSQSAPLLAAEDSESNRKPKDIVSADRQADRPADSLPLLKGMTKLRAVMVYEILVTEQGRKNNVVGRVFRDADIRVADEREVDEAMVGYLRDSGLVGGRAAESVNGEAMDGEAADGARCQLVFLEGSGLKLERAMLDFLKAEDDVSKVGFNLMMNPPVFAAIDRLKEIDPTKVRSEFTGEGDSESMTVAQAISPAGGSGSEGSFVVGTQSFAPLGKNNAQAVSQFSGMGQEAGQDITSQVLVIIRYE